MADEYGLTKNGPNIKRLDTILEEMHQYVSEEWGVNTRQNPSSFLNCLFTDFADKIAELWEFGESVYYSQYPSTAEGINLDYAVEYAGVTRETEEASKYPIHCTGKDGTILAAGTLIASDTNPSTQLTLTTATTLSRSSFNKAGIKVVSASKGSTYTAAVNGTVYSYVSTSATAANILSGLASAITDSSFTKTVDSDNALLTIEATDLASVNVLVLSENLTTETVTCVVTFNTVEAGDILMPDGAITNIVKADSGLTSITNMCGYVAGRADEEDTELRQSYADKIFNGSSTMLDSIRSAILQNVQGVTSVSVYENDTNLTDSEGRWPHSIEVVVDGGDATEIAHQILDKKAAGISTYGSVEVTLSGIYGEDITIRFNRPGYVDVWFKVAVTLSETTTPPTDYADLIKEQILENVEALTAGEAVYPQNFGLSVIGIDYIDIWLATSSTSSAPITFTKRSLQIGSRSKARTSEDKIEVVIDG